MSVQVTNRPKVNANLKFNSICEDFYTNVDYSKIKKEHQPFAAKAIHTTFSKTIREFKTEEEKQVGCMIAGVRDPKTGFNALGGFACPPWAKRQEAKVLLLKGFPKKITQDQCKGSDPRFKGKDDLTCKETITMSLKDAEERINQGPLNKYPPTDKTGYNSQTAMIEALASNPFEKHEERGHIEWKFKKWAYLVSFLFL